MMNILTFDIEEWFHILDHESTKTMNEWKNYEVRIHQNMERIFSILEKNNQKATFFCLGWIAETYPEVIREIVSRGYEIGTHGRMHQLAFEQSPNEFIHDLEYSIKTLEDLSGQKVKYFRAPGFSIGKNNKWAFEAIVSLGIEVDCSIFPARHTHGGFPSYREQVPSLLRYNGIELKEFPINYQSILGIPVIFAGGGYFRLFPYPLIKKWTQSSEYLISYFHPRDFDAGQPVIQDLSLFRKYKSYVGLKSSSHKLQQWISDFKFIDLGTAVKTIDWGKVPVVEI
jgi:polysaccharide deacetylase family protein (PEP-CTERM system associated)